DSERVPETELQNPWILRAGNLAVQAGTKVRRRVSEIDAVQRVEELRPELHLVAFREWHWERLEDRKIKICVAGSDQRVAAQRTERAGGIGRERGRVKPLADGVEVRAPAGEGRISDDIHPVRANAA